MLSASNIGVLFGSQIFGWMGDRYGRKTALVWSNLLRRLHASAAYATSLDPMFWLRLLAGLGIGGVIPNVVAINAELAPRGCAPRWRLSPSASFRSAAPFPDFDGGVGAGARLADYFLDRRHRADRHRDRGDDWAAGIDQVHDAASGAARQAGKVDCRHQSGIVAPPNASYIIEDEKQFPGFSPAYLFRQGLSLITPLLWLLFALNLMGYFFLISWTPTLMTAAKLPPTTVALAGASLQVGGTVGALLLCWWLQKHRFLAVAILFVLAVPAVAAIGYAGLTSKTALLATIFIAGFLVLGIQSGINVIGAMVYPTSLRANGSGWELGVGRIGSIVGPLAGAALVGLPVERLYIWSALPFVAGAVICFIIYRLNEARLAANPELRDAQ